MSLKWVHVAKVGVAKVGTLLYIYKLYIATCHNAQALIAPAHEIRRPAFVEANWTFLHLLFSLTLFSVARIFKRICFAINPEKSLFFRKWKRFIYLIYFSLEKWSFMDVGLSLSHFYFQPQTIFDRFWHRTIRECAYFGLIYREIQIITLSSFNSETIFR